MLLVKYIIDVGPHLWDVPIASTVSTDRTHRAGQKEHLLETNIGNELGERSAKFAHVSASDTGSHHKESVVAVW